MAAAKQVFTSNGNFVCPAGVFLVYVTARQAIPAIASRSPLFIDPFGTPYCLGGNGAGQLGINSTASVSVPTLVVGNLTGVKTAAVNVAQNCYLISNTGQIYGMGLNIKGELGDGTTTVRSSPTLVVGSLKFKNLVAGNRTCLGLGTNGSLYAWGNNGDGACGTNAGATTGYSSPTLVVGGLTWASAVLPQANGSSPFPAFGITTAGALYAWGGNTFGNLGVNDVVSRSSPTLVVGGLTWSKAVCGLDSSNAFALGLTTAGALYGWGINTNGALGVGDVAARSSPTLVLGGLTFSDVVTTIVAGATTYGLTTAGAIYAWGINGSGSLGDGTIISRSSPVLVLGGLTFSKVRLGSFSGNQFGVGLTTAGLLYAWGDNTKGQLGDGTTTNRSSPVAVAGGLVWADVIINGDAFSSGTDGVIGITTGGLMYAWGPNEQGQLGVGDVVARSSPVLVSGGMSVAQNDKVTVVPVSVVPGTTYAVNLGISPALFGTTPIANSVDSITVQFDQ